MKSGCDNEKSDSTGWGQWLARHTPALLLYARQRTRCEADAQDVLQESVLECWRRQAPSQPASALVFATIRRRAIDLARSNERRAQREFCAIEDGPHAWFDEQLEERERLRALQQAMTSLPEIYREVISLKIWGNLTFQQMADVLEIPANTAASRYRYGLDQLRRTFKGVCV